MNQLDSSKEPDLISEYFLRDLSPEELQQLQTLLASDPNARIQFVELGRDEWLLHHVHHQESHKIISLNPRSNRRRRIRAIAAAAALVVTLGTLLYSKSATITEMIASKPSAPAIASVTDFFVLEGEAISVVNDGHVRKLNAVSKIREGDRVVIPPGCQLSFQYLEEETEISLDGGALVHIAEHQGAKRIRLDRGWLMADVAKQPKDKPMRVMTRDAEVVVLGTSFEVFAEQITRLSVTEGAVRFNSKHTGHSVVVKSGFFADSTEGPEPTVPFSMVHLLAVETGSMHHQKHLRMIAVDPVRNFEGMLKFDLSKVHGKILEARLRLRVMAQGNDYGGRGDLRLFRTMENDARAEVAHFSGGVGKNKDLIMDLNPELLTSGINRFELTLDEGGNDFWFSASDGPVAPVLELKVVEGK
ncbi:FecR domain-containing protein [Pontiellaceae bacterium B12227]|nr:FecR domain-containing protein [Pontiellaceae bacterium B12227]